MWSDKIGEMGEGSPRAASAKPNLVNRYHFLEYELLRIEPRTTYSSRVSRVGRGAVGWSLTLLTRAHGVFFFENFQKRSASLETYPKRLGTILNNQFLPFGTPKSLFL